MGMFHKVRPRGGFSWRVQAASISLALAAAVLFCTSKWVAAVVKLVAALLIWLALWLPKSLINVAQWFFDPGVVVMHFPGAGYSKASRPLLALTIDDSPALEFDDRPAEACCTEAIRKSLGRHGARATWFVIGSNVCEDRHRLLRSLVAEGHELGNHGMYDRPAWVLKREEFMKDVAGAQAVIESCGGGQRRWFRPGHAAFTPWKLSWLREQGYRVALGSIYPHDAVDLPPLQFSWPRLLAWILVRKARAGDIIIVHDRPWTAQVLELALPQLTKSFQVCTLSELADACHGELPKSPSHSETAQELSFQSCELEQLPLSSPRVSTAYTVLKDSEAEPQPRPFLLPRFPDILGSSR